MLADVCKLNQFGIALAIEEPLYAELIRRLASFWHRTFRKMILVKCFIRFKMTNATHSSLVYIWISKPIVCKIFNWRLHACAIFHKNSCGMKSTEYILKYYELQTKFCAIAKALTLEIIRNFGSILIVYSKLWIY